MNIIILNLKKDEYNLINKLQNLSVKSITHQIKNFLSTKDYRVINKSEGK